jgi:oxepin-CoA hydrolase/3-oxo-5,6-dehydrosuberyl-CoA semialdehyde dehydrogenase
MSSTVERQRSATRRKPVRKGQRSQGVVAWDVQVTNQLGELVASYNILTLVLKQPGEGAAGA